MKDDEVAGAGNINTAEYWEYDTRLGRRWNVDPVVKHPESPYAVFANNPIWIVDFDGKDSIFYNKSGNEIKRITCAGNDFVFLQHNNGNKKIDGQNYYQGLTKASFFGDRWDVDQSMFKKIDFDAMSNFEEMAQKVDNAVKDDETLSGYKSESREGGKYDFKNGLLKKNKEENNTKTAYMTPEGILMNRNEAGNLLWGMGANKLGLPVGLSMLGGQYASLKDERAFDEEGEQFAIFYGSFIWNRTQVAQVSKARMAAAAEKRAKEAQIRWNEYQMNKKYIKDF